MGIPGIDRVQPDRQPEDVVIEAIDRYLIGVDGKGKRSKEELAREAGLSVKTIYNLYKKKHLGPNARAKLARVLDLGEWDSLDRNEQVARQPLPRLKPSFLLFMLPSLGGTRFWPNALFTAIDLASRIDYPKSSAPGARTDVQPLTYSIVVQCHHEHWVYLQQFLAYCKKYRRQIAGVIVAVPLGTEDDTEREGLIKACEQDLKELSLATPRCPVVILDRHTRIDSNGKVDASLECDGIPMIGPDHRKIGEAVATAIKAAADNVNQGRHAKRDPLRIEIVGTTPRSIPEQLRLQGIEGGLPDEAVFKVKASWAITNDQDLASSREAIEAMITSKIRDALARAPHVLVALTSIVAELAYDEVESSLKSGTASSRAKSRPAIVACDSAGKIRMLEDMCYIDYSPERLAEEGFACWWEIGPEAKEWHRNRNWSMETPVERQRVLTDALEQSWGVTPADGSDPSGSYGQLAAMIAELRRDMQRLINREGVNGDIVVSEGDRDTQL